MSYQVKRHILEQLANIASKSKANKRKVGAIIVNETNIIESVGYNRVIFGECENKDNQTFEHVIHAEEDAIMSYLTNNNILNKSDKELTLYCTYSPCMNCCKLIVQSGIKRLVYIEKHKFNFTISNVVGGLSPHDYLIQNNVEIIHIPQNYLDEDSDTLIIYHSKDVDGLMSGYLLSKLYGQHIKTIGYDYEESADWMNDDKIKKFVFGDITPPVDWLIKNSEKILSGEIKIVIHDHHESKYKDIHKLDLFSKINYRYSNIDSACKIIYSCFPDVSNSPDLSLHYLVEIFSDYDTWNFSNFESELTKNVVLSYNQYFQELVKTPKIFFDVVSKFSVFEHENIILEHGNKLIKDMETSNLDTIKKGLINDKGNIVLVECSHPNYFLLEQIYAWKSDVEFILNVKFKVDLNKVKLSIRSNKANCFELAAKLDKNGGGHFGAASANLSFKEFANFAENNNFTKIEI